MTTKKYSIYVISFHYRQKISAINVKYFDFKKFSFNFAKQEQQNPTLMSKLTHLAIWIAVSILTLASCNSLEEPIQQSDAERQTRSIETSSLTLNQTDVLIKSAKILKKDTKSITKAKVEAVLAQKYINDPKLLSDTVAYIVNYSDNGGFAIIANDSRIEETLAYSETGNFTSDNPMAKAMFIDKIEDYLYSLASSGTNVSQSSQVKAATRHLVIDPQIDIEISPLEPFNRKITEEYSDCTAGFQNVAAATIISHLREVLLYKNFEYNFKQINYALNQGPGFWGLSPSLPTPAGYNGGITDGKPLKFVYSYDGSVSAYCQLLYDLGKDTNTQYNETDETTYTYYYNTKSVLEDLGFYTSRVYLDKNINDICSLLFDDQLIFMTYVILYDTGGFIQFPWLKGQLALVIDGCDVNINNSSQIVDGLIHCVWGKSGIDDGFYSYPILLTDKNVGAHTQNLFFFGVK